MSGRNRLFEIQEDPDPIPVGEMGTVIGISHYENGNELWHQIEVDWDH